MRPPRLAIGWLVVVLGLWLLPPAANASNAPQAMVAKVNQVRASNGVGPVRSSRSLVHTSSSFSSYLMSHDVFGHRSGVSASHRFRGLGEAIALHFGWKPAVGSTVRRWMASPGHRAVLLKPSANWVGVGMARGRFRGHRATIWVLQVGRR